MEKNKTNAKNKNLKAVFKINYNSIQEYIEIEMPSGDKHDLWKGIIEHCLKSHSNNEIKEIYTQLLTQINSTNPDDIPLVYREMMEEVINTMKNRKIELKITVEKI